MSFYQSVLEETKPPLRSIVIYELSIPILPTQLHLRQVATRSVARQPACFPFAKHFFNPISSAALTYIFLDWQNHALLICKDPLLLPSNSTLLALGLSVGQLMGVIVGASFILSMIGVVAGWMGSHDYLGFTVMSRACVVSLS